MLPEQDLVVVITGTTPETGSITPEDLTRKFIIPAVKSATVLPENPQAAERLNVLARGSWQDDRTFVLDLNLLGEAMHEEATFTFEGERVTAAFRSYVYGNVFTMQG